MNNSLSQTEDPVADSCDEDRSLRVGVLTNPLSGGNKKGGSAVSSLLANWPQVLHRQATDPESIREALTVFSRNGVELIVVNGGGGTVQAVLTVLGGVTLFARPPILALLSSGTTSMLSRDVGVAGAPVAALQKVLNWSTDTTDKALAVRSRPILRVETAGASPLFGMFFGAGAICEGINIFHSQDNPMGWRGQLMPALTMLRLLLPLFLKKESRIPPLSHKATLNGGQEEERVDLFLLVSSLERLFLGIRPYWGQEEGPLYYTAVAPRPKCLLRVLWSLFRPGRSRHATLANGYSSHNVQEVKLSLLEEFTLDGELYQAGEGTLTVSSSGPALFLCTR